MKDRYILLVEDNPDDEALTIRALSKNNILNEIVIAHDGAEALEHLFGSERSRSTFPALILLDLKMPKVDGLEVLSRIRADDRTRLIPVVILTSSREEEDIIAGYSRGANAYVRKPVDFDRFMQVVRAIDEFFVRVVRLPTH